VWQESEHPTRFVHIFIDGSSNEVVFLNADGVRMDMMSLVTGLLIGILGGLGLGVGTIALDRRRLLRTLLARAKPAELADLRRELAELEARTASGALPSEPVRTPRDLR